MENEPHNSKAELIGGIAALQQTLKDLTQRAEQVKMENENLREENTVYRDYINNLMSKVRSAEAKP